MNALENLHVRTRLLLLSGVVVAGLIVLAAIALFDARTQMMVEKQAKTRNLVEVAWGSLDRFQKLEAAGKLTREEAQAQAKEVLRGMRYDEKEYFWLNDMRAYSVMHPFKPEIEGKDQSGNVDKNGKPLYLEFVKTVKAGGAGFVDYVGTRSATDKPVPKLSYVKGFEPWGWVVGTGIYIDDVDAQFRAGAIRLGGVALVLVIVLVTASGVVGRSILRQLGGEPSYAVAVTRAIADGNLTNAVAVRGGNNSLLGAVSEMQERLAGIFREINAAAGNLSRNAGEVSTAARESSEAGHRQANATSATAAALEQVTVSINEVSELAQATDASSQRVAALAEQGKNEVADAGAQIERVAATVDTASRQVQVLVRRSEEIGGIANVIKEIADQTNLLALNAAIEAARAGEQGRGFAVVADEVRKLAERTAKATTEIARVIGTVQSETQATVLEMEQALPLVRRGAELTGAASTTLDSIHRESVDSLGKVKEVAHATREQATASNDIADNVEQIASMAEEVNAAMANTAEHAREMEGIAQDLHSRISYFTV